ncbi:inhibitor of nuclear factor kappa-B kinase subunit alpha-like, partial [Saccoglossus kowalevskii]
HEPSILLPYEEQRKAWSHAVYFCSQQAICYQRQLESRRAAMMSLMRYNANQSKLVTQMVEQYHKFTAHMELFVACHEFDIDLYQKQAASGGVSSDNMYKSWLKLKEDCEKYQL